jgi:hypothetical protein
MSNNYFRITAYRAAEDFSVIIDSNGTFEKLWQFSSHLIQKGFKVLEVSDSSKFLDLNIPKADLSNKLTVQAYTQGKPKSVTITLGGIAYTAVKVSDKIYVPDKAANCQGRLIN